MRTEFRRAILPKEIAALVAFDHKVFPKADWFRRNDWRHYESYWMIVANQKAGCCAFERHVDFDDGAGKDPTRPGSLFLASTGILPGMRRMGLGNLMKSWQIAYARRHGFHRIVTNCRKSNAAIVALNKKYGFRIVRLVPGYYQDPAEPAVVLELKL